MQADLRTAKRLLIRLISREITPILVGPPGEGKSSIVFEVAELLNLFVIDLRASTLEPQDFVGLPDISGDRTKFKANELFPIVGDELPFNHKLNKQYDGFLIFLDEVLDASPSIHGALYKFILDKKVNDINLHEKAYIVCASNRPSDGALAEVPSTAFQSRLLWIEVYNPYEHWKEDFSLPNHISPYILAYLDFKGGSALNNFDPSHTNYTFACSRTWVTVNQVLNRYRDIPLVDFDGVVNIELKLAIYGSIGPSAIDFFDFLQNYKDLPTFEEIITDPKTAKLVTTVGAFYALKGMIVSRVNEETLSSVMEYVNRLDQRELAYVMFTEMRNIDSSSPEMRVVLKEYLDARKS